MIPVPAGQGRNIKNAAEDDDSDYYVHLTNCLALSKHAGALLLLIIVGTPLLQGLSTFLSGLDQGFPNVHTNLYDFLH